MLRKKGEAGFDETPSKESEEEIVINHTYNPDDYPKYDVTNPSYIRPEEDVLDFLRRGVDFEARDKYREDQK